MKRRLLASFLLVFGFWPLLQHVLVRRYDVDPWRLFGWAMYCVPGSMKTVRVVEVSRDGGFRVLAPDAYDAADQRAIDRFRIRRQALGRLASGDALARHMLERHPDWQGVALPVLTLSLDPETALTRFEVEQATWWRGGSRDPFQVPHRVFGPARPERPAAGSGPGS